MILGGRNEQGKSSVLDAIEACLKGRASIPEEPVRHGEKRGQVTTDMGDVVVTRTFTESGGGTLTVEAKAADGVRSVIKSPQAWLDARIGALSFDPLEFMGLKPDKQAETLRALTGLDTAELDQRRADVFARRTDINRDARNARGIAEALPFYPDAPASKITTDTLTAQLDEARKVNEKRDMAVKELDEKRVKLERMTTNFNTWVQAGRDKVASMTGEVTSAEAALQKAMEAVETVKKVLEAAKQAVDAKKTELNEAARAKRDEKAALVAEIAAFEAEVDTMPIADTSEIMDLFRDAETVNEAVTANATRAAALKRAQDLQKQADDLTSELEKIDGEKAAKIAALKFPIPGLSIDDTGRVIFNGVPLDQASQAQKIRVSMAIALAANPALKVVLIRDASLLDADNLALVVEMAEAADAQVWLERVGTGDAGAVIIEDGMVAGVTPR